MKIYSYDIFDTCLVRCCGTPDNLFFLLAQAVYGCDADYDVLKNFVHDRIDAERIAKKRNDGLDVCLNDIYDVLKTDFSLPNSDNILQIELETEKKELVPVAFYVDEIQHLRKAGNQIVFISDMYLPSCFLKDVLSNCGLFEDGDLLYVSCEHSASKSTGELFKLIAKEQNFCLDKKWRHTGDNRYCDIVVPRRLGLKVRYSSITEFNEYERTYIDNSFYTPCKEETIQFAGVLRSCRLSTICSFQEIMSFDIVAAIYIPYVVWLLDDAIERGVNHLLFLARDGKIFKNIAEHLIDEAHPIKLTYLHVSRKSLDNIKEGETIFYKYLNQLGVSNEDSCAFVDLGWSGSSRTKLNKLFSEQKIKVVTTYYFGFWGAEKPSYNIINGGNMKVFNYLFSIQDAKIPQLIIPMIFEHYFSMVCQGTTLNYEEKNGIVIPVIAESENSALQEIEDSNTRNSIKVASLIHNYSRLRERLPIIYQCCGKRNWTRLISYPTRHEIAFFKKIRISEMGGKSVSLISDINFGQRLQIILTDNVFGVAPCWKLASLYDSPFRPFYHVLYNHFRDSMFSCRLNKLLNKLRKLIVN